jgi:uncharacterized protein (TIGR02145 family)
LLSVFFTVGILLFTSCSKDETTKEPTASYSLQSSETLPGEVVEIKTSKENKEQEIEVLLDGKPVKAYANGGYSYVFMTPVLPSGNYNIILPSNKDNATLKIKIGDYVAITKPEEVINEFINKRDESFEEIKKIGATPETLLLIDQMKQEWEFQYSKVSEADKLQLAYILQKNTINPDWFSAPSEYPESYYNKSTVFALDAGEKLVSTAKEFVTAETVCLASIPALVGTGRLFIAAPNFVTGAIFVATFTVFIVSREVAIYKAKQVGSLKGVAEAVSDLSNKTGDLVLVRDVDTDISLKVNFRNLKEADLNIQPDITKAFNGEKKFAEEDGKIKKLYDQAIQFTQKLKGSFANHMAGIGKTPERSMTLAVLDKDIIVKGSNNADVKISTTLNGEVRKIKATSSSTKDIDFTLKIAYKREVDGKEITKDIACVYKAKSACGPVTDIDGNTYTTITIGTQCWTQQNLNVSKYRNGDLIPQVTDAAQWANLTTGAWCYYQNSNGAAGKLYNWYALNDPRGLAPEGYHIPTSYELTQVLPGSLQNYESGGSLKSTTGWDSPNTGATNSSGFTALPGGRRDESGAFLNYGRGASFWASSESDATKGQSIDIYSEYSFITESQLNKKFGLSVRCVKD